MKEAMESRDATIEELKARLSRSKLDVGSGAKVQSASGKSSTNDPDSDVSILTRALREREDKIEELQDQLVQASR